LERIRLVDVSKQRARWCPGNSRAMLLSELLQHAGVIVAVTQLNRNNARPIDQSACVWGTSI